ncbi:MAG TPA: serine/threonine-protein kinase [Polyangiaceae bacterium]
MTDTHIQAIESGVVLAGKFRIERVLGRGGMGVVVAAHHLQLDERVALKFLLPEALGNAEAVQRFAREARAAVKIKSEHVARVTDVGTLDSGSPYMVMEYLKGTDLGDLVASQGALPIVDAIEFVLQACEAVAEAHAIGIVHRDLKPSNLFLTRRADGSPCIKVLDFGISKVTTGRDSEMGMTKTAMVMGSPLYMSPEQMASARDVDARTDIWAIGAILHELATGSVPFMADTMPQLCAKILQDAPVPLCDVRPDAPVGLQTVVQRCLQKKSSDRYPTVAELAADLLPYAPRGGRISVERIAKVMNAAGLTDATLAMSQSQAPVPAVAAGVTQQAWGASLATKRSNTAWLALGAVAVVLGGGALVAFGLMPKTAPEPAAGAAAASAAPVAPVASAPSSPAPREVAPPDQAAVASAAPDAPAGAELAGVSPPAPAPAQTTRTPGKVAAARPKRTPAAVSPPAESPPRPKESSSQVPAVDLYQDRK